MIEKKTLDELTLMDDYMFAAVMEDTRFLKPLLEFILQVKIVKIELTEPQKTEKKGYNSKGVRLDLYIVDENGVIYNVEVQTSNKRNLPKRMRYYQSIVDISILNPGDLYNELRKSFIIFICNYDPFGRSRYIYTFENTCREEPDLLFGDETTKVVVNTQGNRGEIGKELLEIINYLKDESITGDFSRRGTDIRIVLIRNVIVHSLYQGAAARSHSYRRSLGDGRPCISLISDPRNYRITS